MQARGKIPFPSLAYGEEKSSVSPCVLSREPPPFPWLLSPVREQANGTRGVWPWSAPVGESPGPSSANVVVRAICPAASGQISLTLKAIFRRSFLPKWDPCVLCGDIIFLSLKCAVRWHVNGWGGGLTTGRGVGESLCCDCQCNLELQR